MADFYAPVTDVPVADGGKIYTPAETVQLITDYRNTHAGEYADPSIGNLSIQGLYSGDPLNKYASFYQRNLAVDTGFLNAMSGIAAGIGQGTSSALAESFGAAWSMISDVPGTSENLANGLMGLSRNPWGSLMDSVTASQTKAAMVTIYNMQGNTAAAAAIQAKSALEFALDFLPANRAKALAELGAGRKFVIDGPCCFAAGYREGGSVGAAFNETGGVPDGYRRVINTKTGNTEVLAADGTFYFETGAGLKPKAGVVLLGWLKRKKTLLV